MHHHFTRHRAAVLLMGLIIGGTQQVALALGLGEITVHSFLNEPLRANIQVLGATQMQRPDCFKLAADDGSLNGLKLELGAVDQGTATLSLSGTKPVNAPIVRLKVTADCGTRVERNYVLLIDPVLPIDPPSANPVTAAAVSLTDNADEKPTIQAIAENETRQPNAALMPPTSQKIHQKKSLSHAAINTALPAAAATDKPSQTNPALSRLSLSDTIAGTLTDSGLRLRLDKKLAFAPHPQALVPASDLQGEVTTKQNRMAHMQTQGMPLQQTRQALRGQNPQRTPPTASSNHPLAIWLAGNTFVINGLIGGTLMLIIAYLGLQWRRQRQARAQQAHSELLFTAADIPPVLYDHDAFATSADDDTFPDLAPTVSAIERAASSKTTDQSIVLEEEGLSILDHADVFLSHGRTALAIQLLKNHLVDFPRQSVTIWLFLLDLLCKENLQASYEETAAECKQYFNIHIAAFANLAEPGGDYLESHPRLLEGLQAVWGTPQAISYLNDLIYNTRTEPRAGLDKNLLEELILLKAIAQERPNAAQVIPFEDKKAAFIEQKLALKKPVAQDGVLPETAIALAEEAAQDAFAFDLVEYN